MISHVCFIVCFTVSPHVLTNLDASTPAPAPVKIALHQLPPRYQNVCMLRYVAFRLPFQCMLYFKTYPFPLNITINTTGKQEEGVPRNFISTKGSTGTR